MYTCSYPPLFSFRMCAGIYTVAKWPILLSSYSYVYSLLLICFITFTCNKKINGIKQQQLHVATYVCLLIKFVNTSKELQICAMICTKLLAM